MKQWTFRASYEVTRICTIEAETKEEAMKFWKENDWHEGHDVDCALQDAEEPDWDIFDHDEDAPEEVDDNGNV